jgi:hypothetical protein
VVNEKIGVLGFRHHGYYVTGVLLFKTCKTVVVIQRLPKIPRPGRAGKDAISSGILRKD